MVRNIVYPAEWSLQSGVQITWPHIHTDWAPILNEVIACYVAFSNEILKREKLLVVCQRKSEVVKYFSKERQANLIVIEINSNDTWARDHGAISVIINNKPTLLDFQFNAWGLKFPANFDNRITQHLYEKGIFQEDVVYQNHLNFVLEGGSIETDGKGTILTTTECLTAPNRNQPNTLNEIETYLKESLGANRILFLDHGYLAGDDTDNHIDTLARFCDENTIAYVKCTDEDDIHYEELLKMEQQLQTFKNADGAPYKLIPLPMAEPAFEDGERLPATYANFLIINGAVLVPFYNTSKDIIAQKQLQKAFPHREVIGIDCSALIIQHGSLHCSAMQFPQGFL